MKKFAAILAMLMLLAALAGCGLQKADPFDINKIYNYRSIPGVTEDEIAAIEHFKKINRSFTFGHYKTTGAFELDNGTYAGFNIKLCRQLSNLFGIIFTPVPLAEWDSLLTAVNDQSVDFLGDLTPTPERRQQYYMSSPIADSPQRLFTLVGNTNIMTETDMNGKRIGFYTAAVNARIIKEKYPDLNFTPIYIDSTDDVAKMLASGEIDGFIADSVIDPKFSAYDYITSKTFLPLAFMPVSVATANPELQAVISVIDKYIDAGGIDKIYGLYREGDFEYARYKFQKSLTEEEEVYLQELKSNRTSINVAMQPDNYPICFYNTKDKAFEGVALDLLQEVSALTGLSFHPANDSDANWSDIINSVNDGSAPMAAFLLRTDVRKDQYLWSDVPYAQSNYAMLSKQDYPQMSNYQIFRNRVGIIEQSAYQDIFNNIFASHEKVVLFNEQNTALDALENGEIDLLMASDYMLLMQTNYREKSGYKINYQFTGLSMDVHFGYNKNETILCSIIDKAQQYVDTDKMTTTWTNRVYDYSKKLSSQRATMLFVSVIVLLLVLTFVFFLLLRNKRLSKNLQQQAYTDSLTGVLNRRHFMELTLVQMDRSSRLGSESYIIIFDLDHFKNVNDTYGHLVGDKVLQGVTQRVKDTIRPYDLFGRYGGEEFILYIADVNKTAMRSLAERIRQRICDTPIDCGEHQITITASFGVACATPKNDLDKATRMADDALYKAKNTGRNRVLFGE